MIPLELKMAAALVVGAVDIRLPSVLMGHVPLPYIFSSLRIVSPSLFVSVSTLGNLSASPGELQSSPISAFQYLGHPQTRMILKPIFSLYDASSIGAPE